MEKDGVKTSTSAGSHALGVLGLVKATGRFRT